MLDGSVSVCIEVTPPQRFGTFGHPSDNITCVSLAGRTFSSDEGRVT
jgi:hypothetical protein